MPTLSLPNGAITGGDTGVPGEKLLAEENGPPVRMNSFFVRITGLFLRLVGRNTITTTGANAKHWARSCSESPTSPRS